MRCNTVGQSSSENLTKRLDRPKRRRSLARLQVINSKPAQSRCCGQFGHSHLAFFAGESEHLIEAHVRIIALTNVRAKLQCGLLPVATALNVGSGPIAGFYDFQPP